MNNREPQYAKGSLSLTGAVAMGTGVMIGAGIFALTGQVAELAGTWFPLAFVAAAVVSSFSAYTLQLFSAGDVRWAVPALGVGLLAAAFLVNLLSNRFIQTFSFVMAFIKIAGVAAFALAGLWAAGFSFESVSVAPSGTSTGGFLGAVALGILAYKGFTTITNSGGEIVEPRKNVGRAIIIAIALCLALYLLVALATGANLSIDEIVKARDYALAEAARPAFGHYGLWFTVAFAIVATVSGVIASVFAVSRMLAMLTEMKLVPHSHFGMPGSIQKHTLAYTIVMAILLTIFFDLSRIASLGAIFYLVMDIAVQWGVFRHLRKEIGAHGAVLVTAIVLDVVVLVALLAVKAQTDRMVIYAALAGMALVFAGEKCFIRRNDDKDDAKDNE